MMLMRGFDGRKTGTGSVRIIGGAWRRRQIPLPAVADLRPTPDRVRETLFNWIDAILPGAQCLDLYAGSGALGFEALSRGARRSVFVERGHAAVAALKKMQIELQAEAVIVQTDAARFIEESAELDFDIVFLDPPYSEPVVGILDALIARVPARTCLYLERDRNAEWPEPAGLTWDKRKSAGSVAFGIGTVISERM